MLRIDLYTLTEAAQTVRQYNDVDLLVEEGQWAINGPEKVLAEFEMTLAMELGGTDREQIRNEYVDIVDMRRVVQSFNGEPQWVYDMEVIGDLKAHEIRQL